MTLWGVRPRNVREAEHHLSQGEIFELLSNERRRGAIHYLKREDREVRVDELVDAVVGWEHADDTSRASVYAAMIQTHLPRMAEAGIVEFDRETSAVRPTDELDAVQLYLEYSPAHDIPWAEYYLGLAAVSAALVTVTWLAIPPFDRLGGLTVAAIVAAVLLASALVHVVQSRRLRLGTEPLERARQDL